MGNVLCWITLAKAVGIRRESKFMMRTIKVLILKATKN